MHLALPDLIVRNSEATQSRSRLAPGISPRSVRSARSVLSFYCAMYCRPSPRCSREGLTNRFLAQILARVVSEVES